MKRAASPAPSPTRRRWARAALSMVSLLMIELLSMSVFAIRGELKGELAFHPLFRPFRLTSSTFGEERFLYDPFLGFRYRPNTTYGKLSINQFGFIDNGSPFPDLSHKAAGTQRILILGGSTVAGSGASSNATTIPAQLERMLNARGGRYEVMNAGVDGYTSFQELGYFQSTLYRYSPDLVIFYDGWNDFAYPSWAGGYQNAYQQERCWPNGHEYALYLLTVFSDGQATMRHLLNTSVLVSKFYTTRLLQKAYRRMGGRVMTETLNVRTLPGKIVLPPEEAARRWLDMVENAVAAVSGRGVPIIYALQPTVLDKMSLTPEEARIVPPMPRAQIQAYYAQSRAGFERLASKYHGPNVAMVDFSPTIWRGVQQTVYLDPCHTNDAGNELIARRLATYVKP